MEYGIEFLQLDGIMKTCNLFVLRAFPTADLGLVLSNFIIYIFRVKKSGELGLLTFLLLSDSTMI